MTMRRAPGFVAIALVAVVVPGCGDGSGGTSTTLGGTDVPTETVASTATQPSPTSPTTTAATTTSSTTTAVPPSTTTVPAPTTTTTKATGEAVVADVTRDGYWVGTTSAGEEFALRIDGGDVVSLLVGFGGDCAADSPMAAEALGAPLGTVDGDTVAALMSGLYRAEVEGRFTSSDAAEGTLLLGLGGVCGDDLALTWEAVRPEEGVGVTAAADWYGAAPPTGVLPAFQIPPSRYDPAAGSSRFDPNGGVFETDGDWFLVGSWVQSFIPVPAGWSTSESGSATLLMFSEELDLVVDFGEIVEGEPEIFVVLASIGYEGDTETIEATVSSVVTSMEGSGPDVTVTASEVAPGDRGFVLAELPWKGDTRRVLLVLCKNPELGWFHAFQAIFDTTAQWDAYYPIVRAMAGGWYGLYGNRLGFELPAEPTS